MKSVFLLQCWLHTWGELELADFWVACMMDIEGATGVNGVVVMVGGFADGKEGKRDKGCEDKAVGWTKTPPDGTKT